MSGAGFLPATAREIEIDRSAFTGATLIRCARCEEEVNLWVNTTFMIPDELMRVVREFRCRCSREADKSAWLDHFGVLAEAQPIEARPA